MTKPGKGLFVYALLLLFALCFRIGLGTFLPNDDPDDGKVFAQLALNLAERGVYSHAAEPPYNPSIVRVPGYPLLLAVVYSIFGFGDNTAVRIVQALIDTATCALVALIAFYWEPDPARKRAASIGALVLAAMCPFTAIYVTTILSETSTTFIAVAMCLTATLAFRGETRMRTFQWWAITGILAGLAVMFRPESGLFAAAIEVTLVVSIIIGPHRQTTRADGKYEVPHRLLRASYLGALFAVAFCLALLPWTLRNWRTFHVFQPLAPVYAEMPGEFVPRGYFSWLRTWLDNESDVATFIWSVDTLPIDIAEIPAKAFDSEEEKQRVANLLERYNHPDQILQHDNVLDETYSGWQLENEVETQPSPKSPPTPLDEGNEPDEEIADQTVAMTPAIDAGFAEIARDRISRSRLRYYVMLPLKRAVGLWFNTHSQYYPFEGDLFASEGTGLSLSQQIFLPLFTALTWIYTFLAVVGCWFLWSSRDFVTRRYLMLVLLIFFFRIAFISFRENPEARYLIELFPFIFILGGVALVRVIESFKGPPSTTCERTSV